MSTSCDGYPGPFSCVWPACSPAELGIFGKTRERNAYEPGTPLAYVSAQAQQRLNTLADTHGY